MADSKFIPLAIPHLGGKESEYLQECIETNFVSSVGPFVTRFENAISSSVGCKHTVATSSGTTGLHVSLVALNVTYGDLVILPSMTFIASANAISHAGAQPWLLDINKESWGLCPDLLANTLHTQTSRNSDGELFHISTGRRVSAIMPVHILGTPSDMDEIMAVAKEFRLPVIADAAAAIGATYKGKLIGNLGADVSVFSFNGNKTITTGGGGAVSGNDEYLLNRIRHLSTTARVGQNYDHDMVGYNYRMTNVQAAIGCAQIEQLDKFISRKREIALRYNEAFSRIKELEPFALPNDRTSSHWFSGALVKDPLINISQLINKLNEEGFGARPFWKPIHLQKPYLDCPCSSMTVVESIWDRILTLPCSSALKIKDQVSTIKATEYALKEQI